MTIRVNSLNSNRYPKTTFINVSRETVRLLIEKALSINIDIKFDKVNCNLDFTGKRISIGMSPPNEDPIKLSIYSSTSVSFYYEVDKFLPKSVIHIIPIP